MWRNAKLDDCRTRCTQAECNIKLNKTLKEILETTESSFKTHYILLQSSVAKEKGVIDLLWVVCQRYLIVNNGGICKRPYPNEVTEREKDELSTVFKAKKSQLNEYNTILTASLYRLKQDCVKFDRAMAKVDASLPNFVVEGDNERQPIYYYIDLFADLFKFFQCIQNKLNLLGRFLMIDDMKSILEYKQLLQPDEVVHTYFQECLGIKKDSNV